MEPLLSLARDISPPRPLKRRRTSGQTTSSTLINAPQQDPTSNTSMTSSTNIGPTLAAIEAGKAKIDDHLSYFGDRLAKASRKTNPDMPRLSIKDFSVLYQENQNDDGHHFVIHQHNHPMAGVHYDLRLQFSRSSSISFAVPKGLPGNPNSRSRGRMAIETRIHNYWNHLIESASPKTGSLLIWDTGTYEVLSRTMKKNDIPSPQTSDDESESDDLEAEHISLQTRNTKQENEKLIFAFQTRYIRIRLHGTRLPKNYTIILRLPSNGTTKTPTARRKSRQKSSRAPSATDSDDEDEGNTQLHDGNLQENDLDTDSDEDAQTRATNAYPGSTNNIGSIHQRHWFLQLDRQNSGFVLEKSQNGTTHWARGRDNAGFAPFVVRGRDFERSVVTGRLAREVERDEGVGDFVGRRGWTGIEA